MSHRFAHILAALLVVLVGSSCDERRKSEPAPKTPEPATEKVEKSQPTERPSPAPPEPTEPAEPDYEDAAGTIEKIDGPAVWAIVPDDDQTRICLPASAPADVMKTGAKVRFTLYLEATKPDDQRACEPVETLASIRVVE